MKPRFQKAKQFPRGNLAGAAIFIVALVTAFGIAGVPALGSDYWLALKQDPPLINAQGIELIPVTGAENRELIDAVLREKQRDVKPVKKTLSRIDFRQMAREAAIEAKIKRPELFVRQIAAESGMQPCVVSPAGAIGIAQIMPATARGWKVDPWIPHNALAAAAKAMARYEKQLGSYKLALAAYNAGPGAVARFGGVPPYAETRGYIARITDRSAKIPGMSQVFEIPQRLTPGFRNKLKALIADVERHGGQLRIEDGWRSYEDSLRIWRKAKKQYGGWHKASAWATPPGCSNHTRGQAADLKGSLGLAKKLAPKHGLVIPMRHEPWHIEVAGIRTQSRDWS